MEKNYSVYIILQMKKTSSIEKNDCILVLDTGHYFHGKGLVIEEILLEKYVLILQLPVIKKF